MINFNLWTLFGFVAQGVFFLRFFVQWVVSEKHKKSVVPVSFWYLSIVGGVMILIYAIHLKDPVFIVGQGCGLIIYIRNLVLVHNNEKITSLEKNI